MLNRLVTAALLFALLCAGTVWAEEEETSEGVDEKLFYSLGVMMAQSLGGFYLSAEELSVVQSGIGDAVLGRDTSRADLAAVRARLAQLQIQRSKDAAEAEREAAVDFVASAAAQEGAETTDTGLVIRHLKEGDGPTPSATDTVTVHYHGTLRDGTVFDSSVDRQAPSTFGLNRVIPCWTEGVQRIKVGGKAELTCPADIAYGNRGAPPKIPPGAALRFEVELLEIAAQ